MKPHSSVDLCRFITSLAPRCTRRVKVLEAGKSLEHESRRDAPQVHPTRERRPLDLLKIVVGAAAD